MQATKEYKQYMLSAIGYGKIILDINSNVKELKKYTLEKYKNGLPKLDKQDISYRLFGKDAN